MSIEDCGDRPILARLIAPVIVSLLAGSPALAQKVLPFRFLEKPGPHATGIKVIDQYDFSRTYLRVTDVFGKPYTGERARPLQTLIWYPAQSTRQAPMTVADYTQLWASETTFAKPRMTALAQDSVKQMRLTVATSLRAVRDAPLASGRFPVVIYAPSFSSVAWENADLCEYLASHGYLVLATPSLGAAGRSMTQDVAGVNAQARDISFLIGYAKGLPDADLSHIAVVGFSWGGLSNLFAAARDNRITALVALDGSLRYFPDLAASAGDVQPDLMTIPMLYFQQGNFSLEDAARYMSEAARKAPSVLTQWTHGDLVVARMLGMTHQVFSSMFQRDDNTWRRFYDPEMPAHQVADYDREDAITGYAWVARYTVAFLDAYLKHDAVALAYLKSTPEKNGVPKHLMEVVYHSAAGVPASVDGFRSEVGRLGFNHAAEIYAALQKDNPNFRLDEDEVNDWAEELIDNASWPEAITLLKLNLQAHPDSSPTYAELGDAYSKSGQRQLAIDNYKLALDKDPTDQETKTKLQELQGVGPAKH